MSVEWSRVALDESRFSPVRDRTGGGGQRGAGRRRGFCRLKVGTVALVLLAGCAAAVTVQPDPPRPPTLPASRAAELVRQVEIRRTTYGVPQILAENLRAAAFALAYVQIEDHGVGVIRGIFAARGHRALVDGSGHVTADARNRRRHARAVETFHRLHPDTRHVYEGFAEGINHYIRVHREDVPDWMRPDFTAYDVLARDIRWPSSAAMNRFRRLVAAGDAEQALAGVPVEDEAATWNLARGGAVELDGKGVLVPDLADPVEPERLILVAEEDHNVGSNSLALGPSRTESGNAILLRNPHLSWTAGYYEAHVRVPGKLDFYGDFRIGGPFTVIGGFNPYLGFATTNNSTRLHEFYAFKVDPDRPDHILLDGASIPLRRELVTVEYRDGDGYSSETREFWESPLGPVVHRGDELVYVFRPAAAGEFRAGEQWLKMMKARNLQEWKDAMRIHARVSSNFTYADRDGNILYVWVSGAPNLPHPSGGDTLANLATSTDQVWTHRIPFDSLPQLLNPPGGYVRNENDSPHFTNLHRILDHDQFSFWVEPPRMRLRSQHGHQLYHNERVFSLEDVVETKHSMHMLLADRVKEDLIGAVRRSEPEGQVAQAIDLLARWDNTAAAESRGGLLFETWWNRYRQTASRGNIYAVDWSIEEPVTTPRGLGDRDRAVEAFVWAVEETRRRFGSWDVAWGDVHRVRRGDVDVPVGGCGGDLGCYRILNFRDDEDGKRIVTGGDGWVIAVEFGEEPRAYTVLGYGQSTDPESPWHANQAEMFAANRMKPVLWSERDIQAATVQRYRPGEERRISTGNSSSWRPN